MTTSDISERLGVSVDRIRFIRRKKQLGSRNGTKGYVFSESEFRQIKRAVADRQKSKSAKYALINGFDGYMVGDDGSIWSCHNSSNKRTLTNSWRKLKRCGKKGGYLLVGLIRNDGKLCTKLVHALVLEAFVGPRPRGMQARHDPDHTKSNCHASNLKWGTALDNGKDKIRHGRSLKGERHKMAKLSRHDVRRIRKLYEKKTAKELSEQFGVCWRTIMQIVRMETWTHI